MHNTKEELGQNKCIKCISMNLMHLKKILYRVSNTKWNLEIQTIFVNLHVFWIPVTT